MPVSQHPFSSHVRSFHSHHEPKIPIYSQANSRPVSEKDANIAHTKLPLISTLYLTSQTGPSDSDSDAHVLLEVLYTANPT